FHAPVFDGQGDTFVTGPDGKYQFTVVPVGNYLVKASSISLAGSVNGSIAAAGETDQVIIRLGDSGMVSGRLVRADGVTPVSGIDVLLIFDSQSANPGRAFFRTDADGRFEFKNIPVGMFSLEAVAADFGGLVK